jgi:hypothetical protein
MVGRPVEEAVRGGSPGGRLTAARAATSSCDNPSARRR